MPGDLHHSANGTPHEMLKEALDIILNGIQKLISAIKKRPLAPAIRSERKHRKDERLR